MSTLTVRNLDPGTRDGLKALASLHGRSMEAEARVVLAAAVGAQRDQRTVGLGSRIRKRFQTLDWDAEIARDDRPRAADLDA